MVLAVALWLQKLTWGAGRDWILSVSGEIRGQKVQMDSGRKEKGLEVVQMLQSM